MCPGPSRPERFRPQGFPPSRRFPRTPVLRSPHPSPLGAGLHAAAVKDLFFRVSFRVLRSRRNRAPLPGPLAPSSFGSAPRSSAARRALISPDFPRLPRLPAHHSPEAPSVTSCVLERSRPRRSGRSPSGARATFPPGSSLALGPWIPRHPQARRTVLTLASLRRPRSFLPPACPTPSPASPPAAGS